MMESHNNSRIVVAETVAEQIGTHTDANIGHLDDPLLQPLSSGGRVLTEGIPLERSGELDDPGSFFPCRSSARLRVNGLKRADQEHTSSDEPAMQRHCSSLCQAWSQQLLHDHFVEISLPNLRVPFCDPHHAKAVAPIRR
jgi:hypothetical protein